MVPGIAADHDYPKRKMVGATAYSCFSVIAPHWYSQSECIMKWELYGSKSAQGPCKKSNLPTLTNISWYSFGTMCTLQCT